jgi:ribosomal protein S18 acetylase RimI-like enzyme
MRTRPKLLSPPPIPFAVDVREGDERDFPALERIARASFDRVYAFFAIRGARHAWPLLVLEENGTVTGFLEGRIFGARPSIGYVYFVAVDPDHRRRSAGRTLVEESLRRFRGRSVTRVFAAVPDDNEASMGLFRALGFREVPRGAMWHWYRWRSVVVQTRMLIAPHEVLLVRTFTDPSPASPDDAARP